MVSMASALPDVSSLAVFEAKESLRSHLRLARQARSPRDRARLAEHLAEVGLRLIGEARCVALYVSRPAEPGTTPLLSALDRLGVRVLLPALGPGLRRDWAEFHGLADLEVRAPGRPPEPSGPRSGPESLADADVVIAPALAVDREGYRLGQGGGWYDRALRHARPDTLVVATVYEEEFVRGPLPRDVHDIPVHGVLTPARWARLPLATA